MSYTPNNVDVYAASLGTACSITGTTPATWNCGIPMNITNLAAAAGAAGFGNNAFDPFLGAHITNQ